MAAAARGWREVWNHATCHMSNGTIQSKLRRMIGRDRSASEAPEVAPDPDAATTSDAHRAIVERVRPYTMTSVPRLQALIDAVEYCVRRDLPGAFAECGVWRGGSVLAMILTLQDLGVDDRDIYLFDTFEGMTAPTEHDVSPLDPPALETWKSAQEGEGRAWSELFAPELFNEDGVRETVLGSGYPRERIHLVRGPVEETLPAAAPEQIALLRLDTDWYESTKHEMEHLYPRLADGGVLIIDDYGHWEGARRAVDEYFEAHGDPVLLNRIDYTGRLAVKH
jgi:O-methyltransferase